MHINLMKLLFVDILFFHIHNSEYIIETNFRLIFINKIELFFKPFKKTYRIKQNHEYFPDYLLFRT